MSADVELPDHKTQRQHRRRVTSLLNHLECGDHQMVRKLFVKIASSPLDLEESIDVLQKRFLNLGQGGLFFELLRARPHYSLSRISLIRTFMKLGRTLGREADAVKVVSKINGLPDFPPVRWTPSDQTNKLRPFSNQIYRLVRDLKYRSIDVEAGLFQAADALSDRIDLPQLLTDRLYEASLHRNMPRDQWERHVRAAFCADHLLNDFLPKPGDAAAEWFSKAIGTSAPALRERANNLLDQLDGRKGTLMVAFHGGFVKLTINLYQRIFSNGIVLGRFKPKAGSKALAREQAIVVWNNERAALFQAFRALTQGNTLFMAGDTPFGNRRASIAILGGSMPVADGPAFLAYETRCNTVWMAFIREGDTIAPLLVPGPLREGAESFEDFRHRWFDFYSKQIENFLCGDPRNLALRRHLRDFLTARH